MRYLENTGTTATPDFILRTGSASPFGSVPAGNRVPHLADLDGDGDRDLILSPLVYYENTGTSTAPAFAERTGSANPLLQIVGNAYLVDAADLDGDGDLELLCADWDGRMTFQRANGTDLFADGFESGDTVAWSATFGGHLNRGYGPRPPGIRKKTGPRLRGDDDWGRAASSKGAAGLERLEPEGLRVRAPWEARTREELFLALAATGLVGRRAARPACHLLEAAPPLPAEAGRGAAVDALPGDHADRRGGRGW